MKIASTIARYLLGIVFLVFGLNGFLHFIPAQPIPAAAGQFAGALFTSGYGTIVFALQVAAGILLLANRYVPLALTVLGAVIVNILLFHAFLAPAGLPMAVVVAILWFLVYHRVRSAFAGLYQQRVEG